MDLELLSGSCKTALCHWNHCVAVTPSVICLLSGSRGVDMVPVTRLSNELPEKGGLDLGYTTFDL